MKARSKNTCNKNTVGTPILDSIEDTIENIKPFVQGVKQELYDGTKNLVNNIIEWKDSSETPLIDLVEHGADKGIKTLSNALDAGFEVVTDTARGFVGGLKGFAKGFVKGYKEK